jgi:hypothetical protein
MSVNTTEKLETTAAQRMVAPREVPTLRLGADEYGMDILRVQEIWSCERPRHWTLPTTPTPSDQARARFQRLSSRQTHHYIAMPSPTTTQH